MITNKNDIDFKTPEVYRLMMQFETGIRNNDELMVSMALTKLRRIGIDLAINKDVHHGLVKSDTTSISIEQ